MILIVIISRIMNIFYRITENISITEVVMKRSFSVIFILLAFIMTIGILSGYSKAKAFAYNDINSSEEQSIVASSKSAYLIDAKSGSVIYSKNENERLPIASMCKIMTLLLCFDSIENGQVDPNSNVRVSENAAGMGGSQVFLESNGEYKVNDLIKSIVVASANDACVAMAETISGSEELFINAMNEKAKSLQMFDTNFVNCTGLPKAGQYSTAKDVSKMFSELIKHEDYFKYSKIWTDKIAHSGDRVTEISNTNKLIRFYQGCDSGKTGYTAEAGHCLAASALRNGMRLISVVISSPDSKTRFKEVSSMFNYGFANFTNKIIVDSNKALDDKVDILGGKTNSIEVVPEKSYYLFSKKNEKRSVEIEFVPNPSVKAPVQKGDVVGILYVYENNKELTSMDVLSNENVNQKTYFDTIYDIANKWSIAN